MKRHIHAMLIVFLLFTAGCAGSSDSPEQCRNGIFSGQSNMGVMLLSNEVQQAIAEDFEHDTQYAVGGTSITRWVPGADLHAELVSRLQDGIDYCAFFWSQGESDSVSFDNAVSYEDKLDALLWDMQERFPAIVMHAYLAPVPQDPVDYPYGYMIHEAQAALAERYDWVHLVDTEGLTRIDDGVHLDADGRADLYRRLIDAMARYQ